MNRFSSFGVVNPINMIPIQEIRSKFQLFAPLRHQTQIALCIRISKTFCSLVGADAATVKNEIAS